MARVFFQFGLGCFKKLDSSKNFKKFSLLKGGVTDSEFGHSAGQRTCDSSVLPSLIQGIGLKIERFGDRCP